MAAGGEGIRRNGRLMKMPQHPQEGLVDLRSDTVTTPTEAMWHAMRNATLGDDGLDGDATVRALEHTIAESLGKEAGLFTPSATMANLVAIMAQVQRQDQLIAESTSHIYTTERAGSTLGSVVYTPVAGHRGAMDLDALAQALDSERGRLATGLICMETTHNNAGGAVLPLAHMRAVHAMATERKIGVHLDGCRMFNAAVALDTTVAEIARHCGTVTVCLSKGLSAPVGAVLAGPAELIRKGKRIRKTLGGTQRQLGIMAAAGLEGVKTMPARLADDHQRARGLSDGLKQLKPLTIAEDPETNIVMVDLRGTGMDSAEWVAQLRTAGTLVRPWGPHTLRCVTHRHIDDAAVASAVAAFASVCAALRR